MAITALHCNFMRCNSFTYPFVLLPQGMMKSSFSSSSSSSSMQSTTKSSTMLGGGGIPGRGQGVLDMMGPGLDIEELSNAGE